MSPGQRLSHLLILLEVGDLDVLAGGGGELRLVILKVVHFAYFNHSFLLGEIVILTSGALGVRLRASATSLRLEHVSTVRVVGLRVETVGSRVLLDVVLEAHFG